MKALAVVLALAASVASASGKEDPRDRVSCSVDVRALDAAGTRHAAQRVSANRVLAVVFRGKLREREAEEAALPLLFDVFNPRGQRYQVLLAEPRFVVSERDGHRYRRANRVREASLAVAGSSIALTSMYGKWRVEPRIEGQGKPCGGAEHFFIRP